ncbi:hypothetical protein GCM10018793_32520 [Streptomyces sulfonofaciens]|uniref:PPM-type phosphatase domain-containing protein n=1 Tax=Streptomyces sulfonofaciens TaxID=68272 RepID=A0A919L0H6_9ACTN|nr:protein phosphatase 2C domain-containing protein [Streptomyces sulfonofaciens]GHH79527.1 hypothetical protein GCM10018793_32520 [Streptomyces sulfonofaciens]
MSQQGERRSGHEDDWWGDLYDGAADDTGPTRAGDTLDDRFASACTAVNQPPTAPDTPENAPVPDPRLPSGQPGQPAGPERPGTRGGPAAPRTPDAPQAPHLPEPPTVRSPRLPESPTRADSPAFALTDDPALPFEAPPYEPPAYEPPPYEPPEYEPPAYDPAGSAATAAVSPPPPMPSEALIADIPDPADTLWEPPGKPWEPPRPPAAPGAPAPGPAAPANRPAPSPSAAPGPHEDRAPGPGPDEDRAPGPGSEPAPPAGEVPVPDARTGRAPAPAPGTAETAAPSGPPHRPSTPDLGQPATAAPWQSPPTTGRPPADTPDHPAPPPRGPAAPTPNPAPPGPSPTAPGPSPTAPGAGPAVPGPHHPPASRPPQQPPVPTPRISAFSEADAEDAEDTEDVEEWALPAGGPPTPAVRHVGDRPPTYDAEPTALPAADPEHLGELVADTVLDGARYGACTVRAVSMRGDSARYRGEPRRDSLLTARFGTGERALVLVAVATGARAAEGAHRAAAEVCQEIGRFVGRHHRGLAEDMAAGRRGALKAGLHRLTDRCLGRARSRAAESGAGPGEYAATLRCLLLPADPRCRMRVFFGVGPGGLFRLRGGAWQDIEPGPPQEPRNVVPGPGAMPARPIDGDPRTMRLGTTAPAGPYEPVPEPARPAFRFHAAAGARGDVLLMCSAGLAEPLRGAPALVEHFATRWTRGGPPGLAEFLADTQVRVKGYADDRTAVGVWDA